MSVLFRFQPSGMTRQQYDEVSRKLQDSGAWPPDGLQLHVAFGSEGQWRVSEVWESEEKQRAFSEQLLPVLGEAGVQLSGGPDVYEVHNFEKF